MRPARTEDHPALLSFLRRHEAGSMFPLVNLSGQGLATRFWMAGRDGDCVGVLGLTETGMVMPQLPEGVDSAARAALAGCQVDGLIGPADQVRALRAVLGLDRAVARHAHDEPGFTLTLADLVLPDCAGYDLHPLTGADLAVVLPWRAAYEAELFATPPAMAADKAQGAVEGWIAAASHRVLWHQGAPVAICGFNARLDDVVQVGGVYVPPALRGRGHARRAVGLHLAEARAAGIDRAVLFAASDAAARAYAALGFRRAGEIGLVLFATPQPVLP